mmetsp:Transcript_26141/g.54369  ORF Transcript_26141/g.54369 Transcript_26141/m.54369 type:complete len:97 (-) Transcript_26141:256-546(-)
MASMGMGIKGRIEWLVLPASAPVACALAVPSILDNEDEDRSDAWYWSLARILAAAGVIIVDAKIGLVVLDDTERLNLWLSTMNFGRDGFFLSNRPA